MVLRGEQDFRPLLTGNLNQRTLVRLGSDLLFIRKHSQIRVTDGPGDGGRDIHSFSPTKQRHLTQCKFHEDFEQTCTSNELSQLPIAMTKLGCAQGLFITNCKISPQGKREFLDNYPRLSLEFLEGDDLANEILSNTLMKALWFDGERFTQVNTSTIFPFLIRRHSEDLPFSLMSVNDSSHFATFFEFLASKYPQHQFRLRSSTSTAEPFEPYRAPEPFTQEEGAFPYLQVMELAVDGPPSLFQLPFLSSDICKATFNWLGDRFPGVTVRVGKPYVCPLGGDMQGARISTEIGPVSYIGTRDSCGEEIEWFSSEPDKKWSGLSDARVTQADWIRLYSEELDCCLAHEIEGRINSLSKSTEMAIREIQAQGWKRSVFCLMPPWDKWPHPQIPEPDDQITWKWDGRILCAWFDRALFEGLVLFRSGNDAYVEASEEIEREAIEIQEHLNVPFSPDPVVPNPTHNLSAIHTYLGQLSDVEIISPSSARHMVALARSDPFPEIEFGRTRTAEVITYPESVPSPIRPSSRRFRISIAWKTDLNHEDLKKQADIFCDQFDKQFFGDSWAERWEEFVCLHIELRPTNLEDFPTVSILEQIHARLKDFVCSLEATLRQLRDIQRSTKSFWSKCYDIHFGISWSRSHKAYAWGKTAEGWTPIAKGQTAPTDPTLEKL